LTADDGTGDVDSTEGGEQELRPAQQTGRIARRNFLAIGPPESEFLAFLMFRAADPQRLNKKPETTRTRDIDYQSPGGSVFRKLFFLWLFFIVSTFPLISGEAMKPVRTDTPPVIDGKLDDPVWNKALRVTDFKSFYPDFGKVIPESTVAYAAYDDTNLYFAFRCFDPEPSKIKATLMQRDNIRNDDFICLNMDTFDDQQALHAFYVNPIGIQMDSRGTNYSEDISVDLVWTSAGRIDDKGYTVEASIPLKSIRYNDGDPTYMGMIFERQVGRRLEHVAYPPLDPAKGYQFVNQMGRLEYDGLKHYAFWEVLPAFTYSAKYHQDQGNLRWYVSRGEAGVTAKYGITPQLILDATYNPDFSQVEADAGQVDINLRSPLYFAEKRPFFLEGTDLLNLGGVDQSRQQGVLYGVYTRTIVNPLAGVKLSGKTSRDGSLAAIISVDDLTDGRPVQYGEHAVIPIVRYKQTLGDDSYVGGIYAGREWGKTYNRAGGLDGLVRVSPSSALEYHALGSLTRSTDSTNVNNGHAFSLLYRSSMRELEWGLEGNKVSQAFGIDDGYLTRTGLLALNGYVTPRIYPSSKVVDRIDLTVFGSVLRDDLSGLWETNTRHTITATILGSLTASAQYADATEIFAGSRFYDNGVRIACGGQFSKEIYFTLSARYGNAVIYSSLPEQGRGTSLTANLDLTPWQHFDLTTTVTYANLFRVSDNALVYDYPIGRLRLTYQWNQYWFVRTIVEYNGYRKNLTDDFLLSFTYIPGTVMYLGYGSLYERTAWNQTTYVSSNSYLETYRGIFFKVSYLWRS
jgi:hypothetical protein